MADSSLVVPGEPRPVFPHLGPWGQGQRQNGRTALRGYYPRSAASTF